MIQKTITKTVNKYGNSGGVYVPSSWIGGKVKVNLIRTAPVPEKDLLMAFADKMKHIVSIILYGSYTRGESEPGSDIDVIIVTGTKEKIAVPKELKNSNYDITIVSREELQAALKDVIFRKTLEDAEVILNKSFLENLDFGASTNESIIARIELAKSALKIIKESFEMAKQLESNEINAELIYPLILRTKEMLLLNCIRTKRKYTTKILVGILVKKGVSAADFRHIMEQYRAVRDSRKHPKYAFDNGTIEKLIQLLEELINEEEKKIAKRH